MRTIEITMIERIGCEPPKNVMFQINLGEIDSLPTLQKGVALEKILTSMKEKMEEDESKLFEGGKDNNGWIKIESEADLPKQNGDYFVFTKEKEVRVEMFGVHSKLDNQYYKEEVTHYQPIVKPEPPKF